MSQAEFWSSTLRQVLAITDARRSAEQDRERGAWERARWIGTVILQPHLRKGKTLKPSDLIKFDWEEPQKNRTKTEDEAAVKKRAERIAKWDANIRKRHGQPD